MGSGTHFDVIEGGEMGPVENEDYAAALVRFSSDSQGAGAVGTIEASRGHRGAVVWLSDRGCMAPRVR